MTSPVSLDNILRLKQIYYEKTLDDRNILKEVETKALKIRRGPSFRTNSTSSQSPYAAIMKPPCSNCLAERIICDGLNAGCLKGTNQGLALKKKKKEFVASELSAAQSLVSTVSVPPKH